MEELRFMVSLLILLQLSLVFALENGGLIGRPFEYNICGTHAGRRVYLEQGSSGLIQAPEVVFKNWLELFRKAKGRGSQSSEIGPQWCSLELVACPTCSIKLTLKHANFSAACDPTDCSQCDHVQISEPGDDVGHQICGPTTDAIISQTRSFVIRFGHTKNYSNPFTLEFVTQKNQVVISGRPSSPTAINNGFGHRVLSSPFFPSFYPRDLGLEYLLRCEVDECQVHVNFIDFQIAAPSILEVYDSDGQKVDMFTGQSTRPRILISDGASMVLRFYSNGASDNGFKADVNYINPNSASNSTDYLTRTDCGGHVESMGGAITMLNMVSPSDRPETEFYDCIWIIRPSNKYFHIKTHLSLRVDTYDQMASPTELIIHQGMLSDGTVLAAFNGLSIASSSESVPTFVIALSAGFYVRLRGTFGPNSSLALVYNAFSYSDCYIGSEFMCKNHKCIPGHLYCDSFDHCGDNSDEPATCHGDWATAPEDRRWYKHMPNYYFPQQEYSDLRTATFVFVTSSVSLMALISCLILVLYRMSARARHQRELQNHLQTISELLDQTNRPPSEDVPDEPPTYEPPPDYEDVITIGMERQIRRSMRRARSHGRRKSEQPILEATIDERRASTPGLSYSQAILEVIAQPFAVDPFTESGSTVAPEPGGTDQEQIEISALVPQRHQFDMQPALYEADEDKLARSQCLVNYTNDSMPDLINPSEEIDPFPKSWIVFQSDRSVTVQQDPPLLNAPHDRLLDENPQMMCTACGNHIVQRRSPVVIPGQLL